jgi:DNA primase
MPWIDFQELREKLDFRSVLEHYGVTINAKNHVQHHGPCPLPTHEGKPRSPSFSANFDKKIWRCFHCGAQGNILDFATRMEGFDPGRPEDVRKAALIVAERYGIGSKRPKSADQPKRQPAPTSSGLKTVINAPLDFALKGLDPDHSYLLNRGFTPETIKRFELGFCSRGLMKDRIAILRGSSSATPAAWWMIRSSPTTIRSTDSRRLASTTARVLSFQNPCSCTTATQSATPPRN